MVGRLEAAPPTLTGPLPDVYASLRDGAMHELGIGTTRDMRSVITGVFLPSWLSRQYTLAEKVGLWRGKIASMRLLRDDVFATDLRQVVGSLSLPVYFFHGRHDYTCSYSEAKAYFDELEAPAKGFYTFEHSAHSPQFEEPDRVQVILRQDVLGGVHKLADGEPLQARMR
jgi:pimeloyl-ACP methyl ester carboxylesterase